MMGISWDTVPSGYVNNGILMGYNSIYSDLMGY